MASRIAARATYPVRNPVDCAAASVWVNGYWRMTFEFKDGHAHVLDYEDYH